MQKWIVYTRISNYLPILGTYKICERKIDMEKGWDKSTITWQKKKKELFKSHIQIFHFHHAYK